MTKDKDSHGSHGGNRGSGESRKDDPNRLTDRDSGGRATNRNDDRAGDDTVGGNADMFEDKGR